MLEQVAAGEAIYDPATAERWYSFRVRWLQHRPGYNDPGRYVVVQVARDHKGESMVPTILPGAQVVIDRGPGCQGHADITDGRVYLVQVDDGYMFKRLFRSADQLILWSDNQAFAPRTMPLKDQPLSELVKGRVCLVMQEEV